MGREISLRAYAKQRGCAPSAVTAAIKSNRLVNSVVKDPATGKVKGIDPALANKEWSQNTDATMARNVGTGHPAREAFVKNPPINYDPPLSRRTASQNEEAINQVADEILKPTKKLNDSRAIREEWQARLAELEYNTKIGKLIDAEDAKAIWIKVITESKAKLLSIPSKAKTIIPHLSLTDIAALDKLVRESLEELVENVGTREL